MPIAEAGKQRELEISKHEIWQKRAKVYGLGDARNFVRKLSSMFSTWQRVLLALLAFALLVSAQAYFWPHVTDDAYIFFRYVDRFVDGHGLTFNPGERVEGFSSPLWVLLLSGIRVVTSIDPVFSSRVLGILCFAVVMVVAAKSAKRLHQQSEAVMALTLTWLLTNPGIQYYATSGMETMLFALLLTACFYYTIESKDAIAAVTIGLAGVTRPEGPLYVVLWIIATRAYRNPRTLAFATLPIVAWQIVRVVYFGEMLPNTAYAKAPGSSYSFGLAYLAPAFLMFGGPLLLGILLATRSLAQLSDRAARAGVALVLSAVLFVIYANSDWMYFSRFLVPVFPIVALLVSYGVVSLWSRSEQTSKATLAGLMVAVILTQAFVWHKPLREYVANESMSMLMKGEDQLRVGEFLRENLSANATVATGRLGAVSYAAPNVVFWDFMGLTDREHARALASGSVQTIESNPILQRNPGHILEVSVPDTWSYDRDSTYLYWLRQHYMLVRRFPQGKFGTFDLWTRQ